MINIFLDDCRDAPSNCFVITRNVADTLYLLKNCKVYTLSLDHDLGENKLTGYDLVKRMVELYIYSKKNIFPDVIYIHSANPVGRNNMYRLLMEQKPITTKVYNCPVVWD